MGKAACSPARQVSLELVTSNGMQGFVPGQINRDRLDLVL